MTAAELRRGDQSRSAGPGRIAAARDVLASEWTKLRSVRSTYWALIVAAVVSVAGSALAAFPASKGAPL